MRKAIPFGLQHVLAMFVANLAPVLIVCSAALVRGMVSSAGRCPDPLCLVARYVLKGVYKNLNILVGLIFGYILSIIFTVAGIAPMVDFSGIQETIDQVGFFSIPKLVFFTSHKPVFNLGSFLTIAIVFLVSAAETTGATTAVCTGALGRDLKMEELQGSLAVDGFSSAISGCFGCLPLTSFSQNVGLVTMTRVINRFTIFIGALILILASLFPPLGAFFNSLPQAVLGGCTVMMFGSIMYEGIKMLKNCEFNDRTMIIVSLSFCIGVGLTQTSGNFFSAFPKEVGDIFNGNAVAGVFVVSLLLSLLLPKKKQAN
jgi:NCS2 family nucleobase:cation symporter-2